MLMQWQAAAIRPFSAPAAHLSSQQPEGGKRTAPLAQVGWGEEGQDQT